MYSIISPIISKFTNKKFELSSNLNLDKYAQSTEVGSSKFEINNKFNIKEMYISNLKVDLKSKIQAKGFLVDKIDIDISDDDEYKIENIKIKISGKKEEDNKNETNVIGIVDTVEKISISISNKVANEEKEYSVSSKDAKMLKEYISSMYDINQKQICVV